MVQHGRGTTVKTRQPLTTAASERAARSSAADLDATVMQALVTAGALVALSDGQVLAVERDELVDFIDGQAFAPSIPRHKIMELFCERVRKLDERYSPQLIMESFRPLAGLSLASIVVRVAHRVAAADRKIRPGGGTRHRTYTLSHSDCVGKASPARRSRAELSIPLN